MVSAVYAKKERLTIPYSNKNAENHMDEGLRIGRILGEIGVSFPKENDDRWIPNWLKQ